MLAAWFTHNMWYGVTLSCALAQAANAACMRMISKVLILAWSSMAGMRAKLEDKLAAVGGVWLETT